MKRLWFCLSPLLIVSACGRAIPQDQRSAPPAQAAAMVGNLYREVVARHPLGTTDEKVFGPYLSRRLLHSFDMEDACAIDWHRRNPNPDLKPDVGLIEFGVFTGGADETDPQVFYIEKVETEKDGSYHAYVKLMHTEASYKLTWHVVVVVIRESGRFVVDDVVYLKQEYRDETRLTKLMTEDCAMSR